MIDFEFKNLTEKEKEDFVKDFPPPDRIDFDIPTALPKYQLINMVMETLRKNADNFDYHFLIYYLEHIEQEQRDRYLCALFGRFTNPMQVLNRVETIKRQALEVIERENNN